MKKSLFVILAIIFASVYLVACGGGTSDGTETSGPATEKEETTEETIKTSRIGDSVETDIFRITLVNAELAIKLVDTGTATYEEMQRGISHISDDYFTADEYNPDEDLGSYYVASKGHTYVVVEFKADNLDRNIVDVDGPLSDPFITVKYNGETYKEETHYGCESANGYEWEEHDTANVLLEAGESNYYRCFIDIPTDAEDLADDFYLTFSLPDSKGETNDCTFFVTAADRKTAAKEEKMSVGEAIHKFDKSEGQAYFMEHLNDYAKLSGGKISNALSGKKKKVVITGEAGTWTGKFKFETNGLIEETIFDGSVGYFNNRQWTVEGDSLVLSSDKSANYLEVLKIKKGKYLLTKDGEIYGVVY